MIEKTSVERTQLTGHFIDRNVFMNTFHVVGDDAKYLCTHTHTHTPEGVRTEARRTRLREQNSFPISRFCLLFAYLCPKCSINYKISGNYIDWYYLLVDIATSTHTHNRNEIWWCWCPRIHNSLSRSKVFVVFRTGNKTKNKIKLSSSISIVAEHLWTIQISDTKTNCF